MPLPPLNLIPGQYHPEVWANEAEMIAVTEHNMAVLDAEMAAKDAAGEFDDWDDELFGDDVDFE